MKKLIIALAAISLLGSCGERQTNTTDNTTQNNMESDWNGYRNVDPASIEENMIDKISQQWMLITAGDEQSYNTMTASWGATGFIWQRPVTMITVRNVRYTFQFLQDNDIYTLSFFPEQYRPALTLLGTKSGRDGDKVAETDLTPMATPSGSMSFAEATMIIECSKLYEDGLNPKSIFDDDIARDYISKPGEMHHLFIGEILNVWVK